MEQSHAVWLDSGIDAGWCVCVCGVCVYCMYCVYALCKLNAVSCPYAHVRTLSHTGPACAGVLPARGGGGGPDGGVQVYGQQWGRHAHTARAEEGAVAARHARDRRAHKGEDERALAIMPLHACGFYSFQPANGPPLTQPLHSFSLSVPFRAAWLVYHEFLSCLEFFTRHQTVFIYPVFSFTQCLFARADLDGDGSIDYHEFLAATLHLARLEQDERLWRAFRHFDADNTGFITRDDLAEGLAHLGPKV